MLARRFTIVCLLISIFGMLFATLVTEAGRDHRSWTSAMQTPCVFEQGNWCAGAARR